MTSKVKIVIDRIVVPHGAGVDRASVERAIAREVEKQLGAGSASATNRQINTLETQGGSFGANSLGEHLGRTIVQKGMT
jgi:hypothetical protein